MVFLFIRGFLFNKSAAAFLSAQYHACFLYLRAQLRHPGHTTAPKSISINIARIQVTAKDRAVGFL